MILEYLALLAKREVFNKDCKALTLENQRIPRLDKKQNSFEPRSKLGKIECFGIVAHVTGKDAKHITVVRKGVNALRVELKHVKNARMQNLETGNESKRHATDAISKFATSLQRITEVEENAKRVVDRFIDFQKQGFQSEKVIDDAHRRLTKTSKRVGLLVEETFVLKPQLSKMKKARDAAVLSFDSRLRKVRVLESCVRMSCDKVDSLMRHESTKCGWK